jgi:hypothetical protein
MRSYQSVKASPVTTHITVEFDWDYIFTTVFRQAVAVSCPEGTNRLHSSIQLHDVVL